MPGALLGSNPSLPVYSIPVKLRHTVGPSSATPVATSNVSVAEHPQGATAAYPITDPATRAIPDHHTRGLDRKGLRTIIAAATSNKAKPIVNIDRTPRTSNDTTMTQYATPRVRSEDEDRDM
jgi:hypothetical protein